MTSVRFRRLFAVAGAASGLVLWACHPIRYAAFVVNPTPTSGFSTDSSEIVGLAQDLAARHSLRNEGLKGACGLALFSAEVVPNARYVTICVEQMDSGVIRLSLREAAAPSWSPLGDTLRAELTDSLRAHFGSRVEIR